MFYNIKNEHSAARERETTHYLYTRGREKKQIQKKQGWDGIHSILIRFIFDK